MPGAGTMTDWAVHSTNGNRARRERSNHSQHDIDSYSTRMTSTEASIRYSLSPTGETLR